MQETIFAHKDLFIKLEKLEKNVLHNQKLWKIHDTEIQLIFATLKKLMSIPEVPKKRIGFKTKHDDE